eukprot:scaffold9098_cov124-Isochrysis_galbana.AAC.9
MARVNRDDMSSAQPRPHGFARAESLHSMYTELKGCAQTLKKVQTVLYRLQHDGSVTRRHYVNPHGPPSPDAPRRLDIIPWFTSDQLDAMRRERTVWPLRVSYIFLGSLLGYACRWNRLGPRRKGGALYCS